MILNGSMGSSITVLVENTACLGSGRGIWAEHGLSYWIDTGVSRVMFDTGASGTVLEHNAGRLGFDVKTADAIILSHGHLDHVGGLETVLRMAPGVPIYMHPDATRPKFTGLPGRTHRSDSLFFVGGAFRENGRKVVESRTAMEVTKGIWMTGEVPRTNTYENTGGPFCADPDGTIPDPLLDDQALFIPTDKGTIVVTGCAHAGLINTLEYVKNLTDGEPIRFVIGGTHLETATPERMEKTFAELRRLGVTEIHPCHCTGLVQSVRLCESVGGASKPGFSGMKIEW
jgi:7,8-dihydropterin-6-yl-methyl-4-(beta-D-ribofuranosyl)aminobenzene 5'-phosphate synthase